MSVRDDGYGGFSVGPSYKVSAAEIRTKHLESTLLDA